MKVRGDRIGGGAAALLVQGALLLALYFGLMMQAGTRLEVPAIVMVDVLPEVTPEPFEPRAPRPKGKAAPPARRSIATPIVVPPPVVPVIEIPPIVAADVAGIGAAADQGAAVAGPGSGSGGQGEGSGSGDAGDGDGGGGVPAEWLRGRIRDSDYPFEAIRSQIQGVLVTRYRIGTNGRVDECRVVKSSGSPILDETTCRLVRQRFRYRPARAADGRKVVDSITEEHAWVIGPAL